MRDRTGKWEACPVCVCVTGECPAMGITWDNRDPVQSFVPTSGLRASDRPDGQGQGAEHCWLLLLGCESSRESILLGKKRPCILHPLPHPDISPYPINIAGWWACLSVLFSSLLPSFSPSFSISHSLLPPLPSSPLSFLFEKLALLWSFSAS